MNSSRLESIFSISVVGGALGLAFADSIPGNVSGWIGFGIGVFGTFFLLSLLATISDLGIFRTESETTALIKNLAQVVNVQQEQLSVTKRIIESMPEKSITTTTPKLFNEL
jgi:hypothetical protein